MVGDSPSPPDGYILLGIIGKAHGLKGEVKITCFSEQPENVAGYRQFYLMNSTGVISRGITIVKSRVQSKNAIVQLETINSRKKADELNGTSVLVAKSDLPGIDENKFYYYQFQGKCVVSKKGLAIGIVKKIFSNGAQDILVVDNGQDEILIPVTKNIIVDETEKELIVDLPSGLLELNRESV